MSATVDTNVLVYASDESGPFHPQARGCLEALRNGPALVSPPSGLATAISKNFPAL